MKTFKIFVIIITSLLGFFMNNLAFGHETLLTIPTQSLEKNLQRNLQLKIPRMYIGKKIRAKFIVSLLILIKK